MKRIGRVLLIIIFSLSAEAKQPEIAHPQTESDYESKFSAPLNKLPLFIDFVPTGFLEYAKNPVKDDEWPKELSYKELTCSLKKDSQNINECLITENQCDYKLVVDNGIEKEKSNVILDFTDFQHADRATYLQHGFKDKPFSAITYKRSTKIDMYWPSRPVIYIIKLKNSFPNIDPDEEMKNNKNYFASFQQNFLEIPPKKISFENPDKYFQHVFKIEKGNKNFTIQIADVYFNYEALTSQTFYFAEGEYQITIIDNTDSNAPKVKNLILKVTSNQAPTLPINTILSTSEMRSPIKDLDGSFVHTPWWPALKFDKKTTTFEMNSKFEKGPVFHSIESIELDALDTTDIKEHVIMEDYQLKIKPSYLPAFLNLINHYQNSIHIKAKCRTAQVGFMHTLYSEPNKLSSPVGKLAFYFSEYSRENKYPDNGEYTAHFINLEGKINTFEANTYHEYCEPMHQHVLYQQVVSKKNGWSQLGGGPWGKTAWIEIEAIDLIKTGRTFDVGDNIDITFTQIGSNKINMSGFIREMDSWKEVKKDIELKDLLDSDGKFKGTVNCGRGC